MPPFALARERCELHLSFKNHVSAMKMVANKRLGKALSAQLMSTVLGREQRELRQSFKNQQRRWKCWLFARLCVSFSACGGARLLPLSARTGLRPENGMILDEVGSLQKESLQFAKSAAKST